LTGFSQQQQQQQQQEQHHNGFKVKTELYLQTDGLAAIRILRSAITGSPSSSPTSAGSRWAA